MTHQTQNQNQTQRPTSATTRNHCQGHQREPRADQLLLICVKAPVAGEAKTRLGATIGHDRAQCLYRAFLTDLARRFTPAACANRDFVIGWAFTPTEFDIAALLRELAPDEPLDGAVFVAQDGDGWDRRQVNLLRWGYDHGYARTVIMASDSPQVPLRVAADAFDALRDHDIVLGRVHDGGYYLVGVSGFHDVLTGVPMSTASAADALVTRARDLGLRVAELPPTFDVDVEADLRRLVGALTPDGCAAPATWAALRTLGLAPVESVVAAE